jgi:hypothetical protein
MSATVCSRLVFVNRHFALPAFTCLARPIWRRKRQSRVIYAVYATDQQLDFNALRRSDLVTQFSLRGVAATALTLASPEPPQHIQEALSTGLNVIAVRPDSRAPVSCIFVFAISRFVVRSHLLNAFFDPPLANWSKFFQPRLLTAGIECLQPGHLLIVFTGAEHRTDVSSGQHDYPPSFHGGFVEVGHDENH